MLRVVHGACLAQAAHRMGAGAGKCCVQHKGLGHAAYDTHARPALHAGSCAGLDWVHRLDECIIPDLQELV